MPLFVEMVYSLPETRPLLDFRLPFNLPLDCFHVGVPERLDQLPRRDPAGRVSLG